MGFALINSGKVVNVIVADQDFIDGLAGYDHKVRIDNLDPVPGIDWDYDSGTNTFTDNRGA